MRHDIIAAGATPQHNEDWAGVFEHAGIADLLIIDGGTSIAERDYVDPVQGDVVWFVTRFASAFEAALPRHLGQPATVIAAITAVHREFVALTAGIGVPTYAWPIAAMTWLRIHADGMLHLYCLGDCTALLRLPDGRVRDLDPYENPQEAVLQARIEQLKEEGIADAATRRARLLPMLRERRAFQNTMAAPTILCLQPNGPFAARRHAAHLPPGAALLVMTDGFYRLVDPYGLHTRESLADLCASRGLATALQQLRRHEADALAAHSTSVKQSDDAAAILWRAD